MLTEVKSDRQNEVITASAIPMPKAEAFALIDEALVLLRDQIEDDSSIEEDHYFFQIYKCWQPNCPIQTYTKTKNEAHSQSVLDLKAEKPLILESRKNVDLQ